MMNEDFVVKKLRGEDGTTNITTRLPNNLIERIEKIVIKTGRNRTQIIIAALEYALDRLKIEEAE
ncbi:MAG: ribbon-helix-helix domain-containing protein [Oscillospiraceae bacterium]|nr:ribbon-helix-helix domain-containing protein [Oscillospiraceae bacterium]